MRGRASRLFGCGRCERRATRRTADEELVFAGQEFPVVLLFVEDGKELRIDLQRDSLRLARGQGDFLPGHQPFGRLLRGGRQPGVDLCDLRSGALAGVAHRERYAIHARFESGVRVGGVRKAIAEGEQWLLVLGVEPLVAALQAFGVIDVECSRRASSATAASAAGGSGSRWARSDWSRRGSRWPHAEEARPGL